MLFYNFILALSAVCIVFAEDCATPQGSGTCLSTSSCSTFSVPGFCSGGASNQCCVQRTCSTAQGTGICRSTTKTCSGTFVAGACPGDSSIKCCVSGNSGGGEPGIPAIDVSVPHTTNFWSCAAQNYEKVVIRGHRQLCGSGGGIDTALLGSYNAARAAGFTNIDVYFFPCTGNQPNGRPCKSPTTQVTEMEDFIANNNMEIGRIWIDLEPSSGECNAWNLGAAANIALAKEFTALIRFGRYRWGVYANANQWSTMFGGKNVDVGSDLPWWAVQADGIPGVNTVNNWCGGWNIAYGKQYRLDTTQCGGGVDLNSFLY